MEVHLAGHNIDRDLLLQIRSALEEVSALPHGLSAGADAIRDRAATLLALDNWTPETISAAYARISRDPRSVQELRTIAREEVDKARRSNEAIIFGLGHASVAEHAVFNIDILGVSRLAVEEIQRMRLCSYTEKSQRYILLDEDFVLPSEIVGAGLDRLFLEVVQEQNRFYRKAFDLLRPWLFDTHPALAAEKKSHRVLEGLAKEDARYGLSMATTVQLGETLNARSLEALIARTAAHPLAELREFSEKLSACIGGMAPSVVKYTGPSRWRRQFASGLRAISGQTLPAARATERPVEVSLVDMTEEAEERVVAGLLHQGGRSSLAVCMERARSLGPAGRLDLLKRVLRDLGPHDSAPRIFEHVQLRYEAVVSAACFAQLKRHRMATLTVQEYDPALGITIPASFEAVGLLGEIEELRRRAEAAYEIVRGRLGSAVAGYLLLNAHRRRVLWAMNLRELYHVARLRLDAHAQWDIRGIATQAVEQARARIPGLMLLACGKDRYAETYRGVYGEGDPPG